MQNMADGMRDFKVPRLIKGRRLAHLKSIHPVWVLSVLGANIADGSVQVVEPTIVQIAAELGISTSSIHRVRRARRQRAARRAEILARNPDRPAELVEPQVGESLVT
jgi:hypothetical protein